MSYDLAQRKIQEIEERKFKVCIADEVHYLKSRESKRSIALIPVMTKAKRCLLISGTPMLSKPVELFNVMKMVRPDIISSFLAYS